MPVRVEISPSQSSFFAGEPFSAKITFTNVAAPEPSPARTHKRGAHSISSAPLARPPTSPGLPPRKSSAFARDSIPVRRGLVGSPIAHDKQLFIETRQSPIPASLSRTNTLPLSSDHPHARKPSLIDGQLDVLSPSISLNPISESSRIVTSPPSTPRVSSPLSPSYSHPPFQSSPSPNTVQAYPSIATTPRPFYSHHRRFSQHIGLGHPPTPQSAFTSTFPTTKSNNNTELVLYSYAQLVGTAHILPETINNNDGIPQPTTEQKVRLNRIRKMLIGRRAVVGGGSMDISRSLHRGNGLGRGRGGLQPQPQPISRIKSGTQQHTRSTSFSQSLISLISPTPSSTYNPSLKSSSSDNVSMPGGGYGSGLGLGISSNTSNTSNNPNHNNNNNNMNNYADEIIDPELALPTFEAQPTMLAVDLRLSPGESKTYTYSIRLPEILPPTYKGRTLSFSYELVVGTCRASSTLPTATSRNSTGGDNGNGSVSRVMKVPIRVYNHVSVDCPMRVYDVLWPVMHNRRRRSGGGGGKGKEVMVVGGIPEVQGRVVEEKDEDEEEEDERGYWERKTGRRLNGTIRGRGKEDELSLDELRRYSERLLNSLPPPPLPATKINGNAKVVEEEDEVVSSSSSLSHSQISSSSSLTLSDSSLPLSSQQTDTRKADKLKMEEGRRREEEEEEEEEEEQEDKSGSLISGCREAVEILTRVPKKASYDVNKEGTRVAVLTFTKSAYRLGETVVGVVEVNERSGRTRVLQLSAILEAHEVLPKSIIGTLPPQGGPGQAGRGLKKAYAEHYAAFTSNMLRTTFALDIPSDASPAFRVKIDDGDHDDHDDGSDNDDDTDNASMGGLEWKIRLCLLVAVASEDSDKGTEGVMFRCLERDGGRGEWGSAWCAPKRFVPLEKKREKPVGRRKERRVVEGEEGKNNNTRSWTRVLVDSMWNAVSGLGIEEDEEEEKEERQRRKGNGWYIGKNEQEKNDITTTSTNYDGIKPDLAGGIGRGVDFSGDDENNNENENEDEAVWKEVKLETVECEVPIRVWPGNTAFRAVDVVFDV
ncbi:hypothetical protein AGABI1DRAFT_130745 [Agaricus bisporus var. burnettii JB137-S8]|uniref:Rgp1-domain-containing protein n=1 Tax=Agaricus bisporus var. burnettii (strain JB137-S8 / ATCC MYA-4627 / FGSC 10392) TaxID=597362 RepID=K5VRC6_AGABU|nr:uncharacterized protein AGABI1DRAFT_130745 [Agaricus bisporus var. burnettii JB137-S8]EKM77019.1 hypothetical protein AGABI1DRAFT_130745 [Agaricus bisporus var. burnettii JB137-S8]